MCWVISDYCYLGFDFIFSLFVSAYLGNLKIYRICFMTSKYLRS